MGDEPHIRKFSSRKLLIARKAAGLSWESLGQLIGRTPMSIYNWEHERAEPTAASLRALSEALKQPMEYFYEQG